jgi:acyl carrier protein phosphodiesterase
MNFLAHAYLSFGHKEVLVGNMISDFVKGNAYLKFDPGIQNGIRLHRDIDSFTDTHPVTREAKAVFRPQYRLFSGVIVDILFDHFLANDAALFAHTDLYRFTQYVYQVLEEYSAHLPGRFVHAFYYMRTENWLYGYQTKAGIENSLRRVVSRSSYLSDSQTAIDLFLEHYLFLQQCFAGFFEDVKMYSKKQLDLLTG